MKKTNYILLLFLLFIGSYCTDPSSETEAKEFINTFWKLGSFETDGMAVFPPKDQVYNIKFKEDGKFNGINDCNEISGHYSLKSSGLTIDSLATTKIYCGDASLGGMYVAALQGSKSYKINKNKLIIFYGTNSKMNFIGE